MATKKTETVTTEKTNRVTLQVPGANGSAALAPATVVPGIDAKDSVYDAVSKDLATVGGSDAQIKKIGSGPLGETRGQDVLRLHASLRAADLLNGKLNRVFVSLQSALADVDSHLHTDAASLATQADRSANALLKALEAARADLNDAVETAQGSLTKTVEKAQSSLSDQLTKAQATLTKSLEKAESSLSEQLTEAQTALSGEVSESLSDLQQRSDALLTTVKDSFSKLAKATAGSEENLKAQTNSFSTAVEELLNSVQNSLQKQVFEFREELTRQVDKRMNQGDVAFAAVRADQEVIKALLTDIIKDRMGRAEPKYR